MPPTGAPRTFSLRPKANRGEPDGPGPRLHPRGRRPRAGGRGTVYAVIHAHIGKKAALKLIRRGLLSTAYTAADFLLEARAVNVVTLTQPVGATTVLMGPQFYAESFGTSAMTLRLRNATLVGDPTGAHEFGIGLHTFIADGAAMTLDGADSIIDGASDSGTCSLWPTLRVTSAGHNVVSPGCLPSPAATDIVLASTSPTASAGLGGQVVTDLGFPYYPLTDGSPAIDAGDPAGCSDGDAGLLTADALGRPRTGTCDAGAIER